MAAILPKSKKLRDEEASDHRNPAQPTLMPAQGQLPAGPLKLKSIPCYNHYIALLVLQDPTPIVLPEGVAAIREGVVVGVGPGIPGPDGSRCPPTAQLGDHVLLWQNNIITQLNCKNPPYVGQQVIIVAETSLLCKLGTIEWSPFES